MGLFEEVVNRFGDDRYGPKSLFSLGDYYYSLKDYDRAKFVAFLRKWAPPRGA